MAYNPYTTYTQMVGAVSNIYLTQIPRQTEFKLVTFEEILKIIVACGNCDVTPTMTFGSATDDIAVKQRLKQRKQIEFVHG
jgi:hypothetical protein